MLSLLGLQGNALILSSLCYTPTLRQFATKKLSKEAALRDLSDHGQQESQQETFTFAASFFLGDISANEASDNTRNENTEKP
jgi:hypothetical protein